MITPSRQSGSAVLRSWVVVVVLALLCLFENWAFAGAPALEPDRIAAAETRMWQAYYSRDLPRLHGETAALLRAQFRLSGGDADRIAKSLAFAAINFAGSPGNYEQVVLPDLEVAYLQLRGLLKLSFDPREAARAELAWWSARRTPGQNHTQQVGKRIAELYSVIYGVARPEFLEAGVLRAEAAQLRDRSGVNCDWAEVERLLRRSYQILAGAVP